MKKPEETKLFVLAPGALPMRSFRDFDAAKTKPERRPPPHACSRLAERLSEKDLLALLDDPLCTRFSLSPIRFPVSLQEGEDRQAFFVRFSAKTEEGRDVLISLEGTFSHCELYLDGLLSATIEHCLFERSIVIRDLPKGEHGLVLLFSGPFEQGDAFRRITIASLPKTRMLDVHLRTRIDANGSPILTLDVTVEAGDLAGAMGGALRAALCDERKRTLSETTIAVPAFRKSAVQTLRMTLSPQDARLWSPEEPIVYRLYIGLLDQHQNPLDVRRLEIGLAAVSMRTVGKGEKALKMLCLNDKPIKLQGIVKHCPDDRTPKTCKCDGYNAVRAVDVNDLRFFSACLKEGLLVMPEVTIRLPEQKRTLFSRKRQQEDPMDGPLVRVGELVSRLKNEAAILLWSLGSIGAFGYSLLAELIRLQDATRPVNCEGDTRMIAGDFFSAADCTLFELTDVVGGKDIGRPLSEQWIPFRRYRSRQFLLTESSLHSEKETKDAVKQMMAQNDRLLGAFYADPEAIHTFTQAEEQEA